MRPVTESASTVRVLRALALYGSLTVLLTYPFAFELRQVEVGDPAFFAWEIGWEIHALKTDPTRLPHANMYHPARHTLGMDEPVLGTTLLVLPLGFFTENAAVLFNVARLLTFLLSALAVYLLARDLGCGEGPSLFAGAAFAFSPVRTDQIAHLSTLGTQWMPPMFLFLHRFGHSGRLHHALLAALFFALTAYSCGYYGLLGALIVPWAAVPLFWGRLDRLPAAVVAAMTAALALLPLYALNRAGLVPHGYLRGEGETILYSAGLDNFLVTNPDNWIYGRALLRATNLGNSQFPGLVPPLLALLGAAHLWRRRTRPTRDALALAAVVAAAVLVALGPEVRVGGRTLGPGPFTLVRDHLPVFHMIRNPSRAGTFMALALSVLAAKGLAVFRPGPRTVAWVGALAMAEVLIVPISTPPWRRGVDTSKPTPLVYTWLAEQAGEFAVVELPLLEFRKIYWKPAYHESTYLVHSTVHWKRLVNGYAGVEPAHYRSLRVLLRHFPSEESLEALRAIDVRYVVLHRKGYGPRRWARIEEGLPRSAGSLKEIVRFGDDRVLELLAPATAEGSSAPP